MIRPFIMTVFCLCCLAVVCNCIDRTGRPGLGKPNPGAAIINTALAAWAAYFLWLAETIP